MAVVGSLWETGPSLCGHETDGRALGRDLREPLLIGLTAAGVVVATYLVAFDHLPTADSTAGTEIARTATSARLPRATPYSSAVGPASAEVLE